MKAEVTAERPLGGRALFWFLMKYVFLGPWLRLAYRPQVSGIENVPVEGGAILAANHQSFLDDLLLPLVIPGRKVVFLGKAEYFDKWYLRWFFKGANMIPVRRGGGSASEAALAAGVQGLREGKLIGIFPEGTRSPDGRLYRGKTGVARMALEARVPVVPAGIVGTLKAMPYDRKIPRPAHVEIRFGKPLTFDTYQEMQTDRFIYRAVTDEIMYEIMSLSGQEYTDEDATRVKKRITARKAAKSGGDSGTDGAPEERPASAPDVAPPPRTEQRTDLPTDSDSRN